MFLLALFVIVKSNSYKLNFNVDLLLPKEMSISPLE